MIIDENSGEDLQYFRFQFMNSSGKKKKGKLMTVVPEEPPQYELLVNAFKEGMHENIEDRGTEYVKRSLHKIE